MGKRIIAIAGLILLGLLYLSSLVLAVLARPEAYQMFMVSLVATILLPILLWAGLKMYEKVHENDGMTMRDMRKLNKRLKAGESPEKLAEEIEAKYGSKENKENVRKK